MTDWMIVNHEPHKFGSHHTTVKPSQDIIVHVGEQESNMFNLTEQPLEVLHQILTYVGIDDLPNLVLTCRHLHDFIGKDDLLWRVQYLKYYDKPRSSPPSWREAAKKMAKFQDLCFGNDRDMKEDSLEHVANTAIDLIMSTESSHPYRNQAVLAALMFMRSNKSAFLSRSSLFGRAGLPFDTPADTEELRQLSAKLHVFYGQDVEPNDDEREQIGTQEVHPYARSRVYDLRRYNTQNYWGPFMNDGSGRVDWEKVQSIMIVLLRGWQVLRFRDPMLPHAQARDHPFYGLSANSFDNTPFGQAVDVEDEEQHKFAAQDPYGVHGSWFRLVNFLDYHDLFAYNFQPPFLRPDQEREPIHTKEAIRLILLKLKVKKIEMPGEHEDPENDLNMPIVHFEGTSKSLTNRWDINGNSRVRGYVRTTKHGDIRWTTFSVFYGEERWRSESVQIGGIRSARGTIGNWFDKNYDNHGPAGPTAFWKVSNLVAKERDEEDEDEEVGLVGLDDGESDEDEDEDEDGEEGEQTETEIEIEVETEIETEAGTETDAEVENVPNVGVSIGTSSTD